MTLSGYMILKMPSESAISYEYVASYGIEWLVAHAVSFGASRIFTFGIQTLFIYSYKDIKNEP